jgi:hypothetical protein
MFENGKDLGEATRAALVTALKLTACREIDPEHFLIALLDDPGSPLSKGCSRLRPGINLNSLREAMITSIRKEFGPAFTGSWTDSLLSARSRDMIAAMTASPNWASAEPAARQARWAVFALRAAKPRVRNIFAHAGVDANLIEAELEQPAVPQARPEPFTESGSLNLAVFDAAAESVLRLVETEGRALGLSRIGTPLLLFALISRENGILERGLRLQLVDPRQLHQSLLLQLKALGKNPPNDDFAIRRDAMQSAVAATFARAADMARDLSRATVGEGELVQALLVEDEHFAVNILEQAKVNIKELSQFIAQRRLGDDADERGEKKRLPTIQEVEQGLRDRIIGQDHAIDLVMPFLKRQRFGVPRPGRPMGVFLFLGMSGTGKTQLAKEIAQAVYGAPDRLIFLEMGQFGTEHSKTIFVERPRAWSATARACSPTACATSRNRSYFSTRWRRLTRRFLTWCSASSMRVRSPTRPARFAMVDAASSC